jgi:hypothetical protein
MQVLSDLIAWIYERIDPEDRESVSHQLQRVEHPWPGDPSVVIANYTALIFSRSVEGEELEVRTSADSLLRFPRNVSWLLLNIANGLGVKVNFEFYQEPEKVVPYQPVGKQWVAQGPGAYFPIDPNVRVGDTFTDERGLFLLVRRVHPMGVPFNVWIKQEEN